MSVGCIHNVAVVVVPLKEELFVGRSFYYPAMPTSSRLDWAIIDDLSEWECLPLVWRSPLHRLVEMDSYDGPDGILASPAGAPRPLLHEAALQAFGDLPMTTVRALAKHIQCRLPVGCDLFEAIRVMIKFIMPELSDSQVLDILAARIWQPSVVEPEFFSLEIVKECFGESDLAEVEKFVKSTSDKVSSAFAKSFKAHVQRVRGGQSSGGGAGASSSSGNRSNRRPTPDDVGDFTQEEAQTFLPTGARLSKDLSNGRWLVVHPPSARKAGISHCTALSGHWPWCSSGVGRTRQGSPM